MTRTPRYSGSKHIDRSGQSRRRRRIERQLRALQALEARHRRVDLIWAVTTIAALSALWLAVFVKVQALGGSWVLAAGTSVAFGSIVWWVGRRWLSMAWLIVVGLVIILLEDLPDVGDWSSDDKPKSAAERRRAKLQAAIAKREALLARMKGTTA